MPGLKAPGTNVWQYSSNNSDAQKWLIQKNSDNTYSIISKGSGLYIDINAGQIKNGSNIQVYTGNGTNAQKFMLETLTTTNNKTIDNGTYAIKSAANTNYCIDVDAGSKNNGANIQIYKYSGLDSQKFKIEYNKDGYYTIKAIHSSKALDVYARTEISRDQCMAI